eukprot:400062_1
MDTGQETLDNMEDAIAVTVVEDIVEIKKEEINDDECTSNPPKNVNEIWIKLQELENRLEQIAPSTVTEDKANDADAKEESQSELSDLSTWEQVVHYGGKLIYLILFITHKVHSFVGTLIAKHLLKDPSVLLKYVWIVFLFPIVLYTLIPVTVCLLLLLVFGVYDEIQSWMIAYMIWGICISIYWFLYATHIRGSGFLKHMNAMLWKIVGIDLPEDKQGDKGFISIILASLLPAMTAGFIANFMLEEKFMLECHVNTKGNICVNSGKECCEVISSHDITNMYLFFGSLVSNILGVFAVIRIVAFLLTKGDPDMMKVAQRRK